MNVFLNNLAEAINQPGLVIQPDQALRELPNWDSLAVLTTLAMIDEQYSVTLSGADVQACATVGDLYRKVQEGL